MRSCFVSVVGIIAGLCLVPFSAAAQDEASPAEIAALLKQLDADNFDDRERATEALIKIGEPAEPGLKKLAGDAKSPEVKERAARALQMIDRARLQRNALKLDVVYQLARRIAEGKSKATDLDPVVDKILEDLAKATKRDALKMPVRAANCAPRPGGGFQPNTLYVGDESGNSGHLRDSVIVLDMGGQVSHAQNSVIVAWGLVDVSSCQNCVIIGGADVSVSHAQDCVILAGGRVDINHGTKTIVGAGETVRATYLRDNSFVVNTKYEPRAVGGEMASVVEVPGLVLREKPVMERLLDDKVELSHLSNAFMLVKVPGHPGEHVIRPGSEFVDAYGKKLPGLEGWKLARASYRFALLQKDDQRTYLRSDRGN